MQVLGDKVSKDADVIYRYLNFDQMEIYAPKKIIPIAEIAA